MKKKKKKVAKAPAQTSAEAQPFNLEEFETLKTMLASPDWPLAVDADLICSPESDQDKLNRADGILDVIVGVNLNGKRFLDFGCGEGHTVEQSLKQTPAFSVGYDIENQNWSNRTENQNTLYTTNWEDVAKNGPYDVILVYDVIDHIPKPEVIENLKKLRSVMQPKGRVFVRCHPWFSRHATHLYRQINKAYVHLVFTKEELEMLNYKGMYITRMELPMKSYMKMFANSGFNVRRAFVTKRNIESFFKEQPLITTRIMSKWKEKEISSLT